MQRDHAQMELVSALIGVEAGASTITVEVELADEKGTKLGQSLLEKGANISATPPEIAWQNIIQGIKMALEKSEISLEKSKEVKFYLFIGAPGMSADTQRKAFIEYGQKNYPYFETVIYETDAYLTWRAMNVKEGTVFIAGSGAVGMYFSEEQLKEVKLSYPIPPQNKVSGFGFPHDDSWGLARMGLKIVELLIKYLDGRIIIEDSRLEIALKEIYQEYFNSTKEILVSRINTDPGSNPYFTHSAESYKKLTENFLRITAHTNEAFTQKLFKEAAKEFTLAYNTIMKGKDCLCYAWGTGYKHFEKYLPSEMSSRLITQLKMTPAHAGISVLRKMATPAPTPVALTNLKISSTETTSLTIRRSH